jgi:hypothetical protein
MPHEVLLDPLNDRKVEVDKLKMELVRHPAVSPPVSRRTPKVTIAVYKAAYEMSPQP